MTATNAHALIALGTVMVGAVLLIRSMQAPPDGTSTDPQATDNGPSTLDTIMSTTSNFLGLWKPPAKYAAAIAQAEDSNGIPQNMLARLLYQECRYRADIISGATTSPAGAQGIAQFMPATAREMGIDPLDPAQAIPAAARYLAQQYRRFGTWTQALAAYNWGAGNVSRKGLDNAPSETRKYFTEILADVNATNGTSYA